MLALLALLVWRVVHDRRRSAAGAVAGASIVAPDFTWRGSTATAALAGVAARQGRRPQLLGLVVRAVQGGGPLLEAAWKKYKPRGVVVVGIDANDFKSDARTFARRYGVTYPIVHDGPDEVRDDYGVDRRPGDVLRRPDGRSRRRRSRRLSVEEIDEIDEGSRAMSLVRLLAGRAPSPRSRLAAPAGRPSASPTLADLEDEVVCPRATRRSTSRHSPVADRMQGFIRGGSRPGTRRRRSRRSSSRSSASGCSPAAAEARLQPPRVGAAARRSPSRGGIVGVLAVRWSRRAALRPSTALERQRPLDPELERRIDDELARFDA